MRDFFLLRHAFVFTSPSSSSPNCLLLSLLLLSRRIILIHVILSTTTTTTTTARAVQRHLFVAASPASEATQHSAAVICRRSRRMRRRRRRIFQLEHAAALLFLFQRGLISSPSFRRFHHSRGFLAFPVQRLLARRHQSSAASSRRGWRWQRKRRGSEIALKDHYSMLSSQRTNYQSIDSTRHHGSRGAGEKDEATPLGTGNL